MMSLKKIKQFAIENGYDEVVYLGEWQGYKIYQPLFNDEDFPNVGLPLKIMVMDETIRMSEDDEAFILLDVFEDE
ncbi:hypothetical protein ACQ9ZF_05075 [Cetobacterium somerae]|uniref:hypothetical protein n=1 Tax=Cetobacterium somerae TaxID=188913 RepID=UPI003D768CC1